MVLRMTTPMHNTIHLSRPHDVLAAIPHLLGFWPSHSLVVIGLHEQEGVSRFGMTLRADLPTAEHHRPLANYLVNPVRNHGVRTVLVVVVGPGEGEPTGTEPPPEAPPGQETVVDRDALPYREAAEVLCEVFETAGIEVLHAVWTREIRAGGQWWCYEEDGCGGEIADPKVSSLAAAMAAAGVVTFNSREEVEALVAPEPADVVAGRAARLDALHEDTENERSGRAAVERDLQVVYGAIRRTGEGAALTEDDYVRVLLALSDSRVRDVVLGTALGASASAAEQLWLVLVRKAPAPELADVAALLTFSAYLRGDGTLAGVALSRIESTRPDHRLGNLLRQAVDAGIRASELAVIARDAVDDARMLIEEDGAW